MKWKWLKRLIELLMALGIFLAAMYQTHKERLDEDWPEE
jgi:hypothetical protein